MRMKILKRKQAVWVAAVHMLDVLHTERPKPVAMAEIRTWQGEKL